MADQGIKTPIPPGLVQRVAQGVRYMFTGKGPDWFGPNEPLTPVAPPETVGRAFDYPMSVNLQPQPRTGEAITFPMLRALADSYDLLRLVLETRKDQVVKMDWQIKLLGDDKGNGRSAKDPRIEALQNFFRFPDRVHSWQAWLRIIVEDMLVLDAPCVYPRRTNGGEIYGFEPVDGATIKIIIDSNGRPPVPPDPAYQQILKGLPANEYAYDQLIYIPRNPRAHKIYGYSPVEQIIVSVNMALRRQMHQLEFYTEGSVPDALLNVPLDWTVDQIKEFQLHWDSLLAGQTGERRKVRFIPGGMKPFMTKEAILKDEMDEWLARIVCYCFSVAPTPFVKQMNRATAASVQEAALNEGLVPLLAWIKDFMDYIIWKFFNYPDLEFAWAMPKEIDADVQSAIQERDVRSGIRTIDEVRDEKGLDSYPDGLGAKPLVYTASGATLLEEAIKPPEPIPAALSAPGLPPGNEPPPTQDGGNGKGVPKAPGKKKTPLPAPEKFEKRGRKTPINPIDRERPLIKAQTGEIKDTLAAGFEEVSKDVAAQVVKEVPESVPEDLAAEVERIVLALDVSAINDLIAGIQGNIEAVAQDGAAMALIQINYDREGITDLLNEKALAYAQERSAELVGKRIVDGEVVDNPNAKWSIGDNTRDMLRGDVSQAIEEGWSNDKLASAIEENYGFSPERAETIARTETAFADVAGNMEAYRESGIVQGKQWIMGSEHDQDDECLIGSTLILAGQITRGIKRLYSGPIIDLYLSTGDKLTGTPNHPVLTDEGWKPLDQIQKGDYLISSDWMKRIRGVTNNFDQMETRIEDKVASLNGRPTTMMISPRDLHGDGIGSHVYTVTPNRLLDNKVASVANQIKKAFFSKRIKFASFFSGNWNLFVRFCDQCHSLLRGRFLICQESCFSGTSQFESPPSKPLNYGGPGYTSDFPDLVCRQILSEIKTGEIISGEFRGLLTRTTVTDKIERFDRVYVFNLSTKDGFFISQNVVVRNCNENADAGVIGLDEEFPSGDDGPPAHPNACFEGYSFMPYGSLHQMLRSRYNGPAVTIEAEFIEYLGQPSFRDASGSENLLQRDVFSEKPASQGDLVVSDDAGMSIPVIPNRIIFTIGPNHPVLTRRGFVKADNLRKGDELVYDARCKNSPPAPHSNLKERKNFEDIFGSLFAVCGHANIAGPRDYFHGDEVAIYGEVDVVRPERDLLPILNPLGLEKLAKFNLMETYSETESETTRRTFHETFERVFSATPGSMGRSDLNVSLIGSKGRPPELHPLRIIACHKTSFEGWAFDASTEYSIYNMGGIVVKNCVCDVIPALIEGVEEKGD